MTLIDEGRQIRGDVAKLRPDKRRRYPSALKVRILDWVRRATASGMLESECGRALGIKAWRLTTWQREQALGPRTTDEAISLVPIAVAPLALGAGPTLVTPTGYRVEGLAVDQLAALLRELL